MATRRLEVIIAGDAKGAKQAFDDTEKDSGSLADKMKNALGPAGVAVGTAAIAAAAGIGVALKGAYEAAVESQKIANETERVIRTTGGAANVSADQVSDLATRLSELTGVDDEVVQGTENLLLTFTNVKNEVGEGNDVFTQATGLALDMAQVLGVDASGAAIQLGKALNDPIKGITALSRAGVSFTEQQREQIKEMVQAGDTLGAQKIILAELQKEFGGAAEAAATPLEKLQVKIGNFQEAVGAKLIPAVDAAATWLGDNLPSAIESATGFLSEHLDVVEALAAVGLAGLAAAYGPVIAEQVALVATNVAGFFSTVASNAIYAGQAFMTVASQQGVLVASNEALAYAMGTASFALPALGLAVFGVMHFYNEGRDAAEDFRKSVEAQYDLRSTRGLQEALEATRRHLDDLRKSEPVPVEDVLGWLQAEGAIRDVNNQLDGLNSASERSEETFRKAAEAIQATQPPAERTTEKLALLHDQVKRISDVQKIDPTSQDAVDKLVKLQEAASSGSLTTDRLAQSMQVLADDTSSAEDKVKGFKDALDAVIGVHVASQEALNKYAASIDTVAQKVGVGVNLTDAFTARNREARDAVNASAQAAIGYAVSMAQETGNVDGASNALLANRQRLIETMVQHGLSRQAAEAYINTLGLTPANVRTLIEAQTAGAVGNVQSYQAYLNSLPSVVRTRVEADVSAAEASLARFNIHLNDLERRVIAANANYGGRFAEGGIIKAYASGGREDHVAQISSVMRLWGEPETGGEAYIPLSPAKRGRSTAILSEVADRFGYALATPMGAPARGASGAGDTVVVYETHLHVNGAVLADEEALGRLVNRAQQAARRRGDRMPWDQN